MTQRMAALKRKFQIARRFEARVHPVVVAGFKRTGVEPATFGSKECFVLRYVDLDRPAGTGRPVPGPHEATHATVGVGAGGVIHGRRNGRGVADVAEV